MFCETRIMIGHDLVDAVKDKPWRWIVDLYDWPTGGYDEPEKKLILELMGNETNQEEAFGIAEKAAAELVDWWKSRPHMVDVDMSQMGEG